MAAGVKPGRSGIDSNEYRKKAKGEIVLNQKNTHKLRGGKKKKSRNYSSSEELSFILLPLFLLDKIWHRYAAKNFRLLFRT